MMYLATRNGRSGLHKKPMRLFSKPAQFVEYYDSLGWGATAYKIEPDKDLSPVPLKKADWEYLKQFRVTDEKA